MLFMKKRLDADPKFTTFLSELEMILKEFFDSEFKAKQAREAEEEATRRLKISPVAAGWQRKERAIRSPRSPRAKKIGPSKALHNPNPNPNPNPNSNHNSGPTLTLTLTLQGSTRIHWSYGLDSADVHS